MGGVESSVAGLKGSVLVVGSVLTGVRDSVKQKKVSVQMTRECEMVPSVGSRLRVLQ